MSVSSPLGGRSSRRAWFGISGRRAALDRWLPVTTVQKPLLVVYALWVAVALLYWPSSKALVGFWTDTADMAGTHGFLVLLIALGLIVRDRGRLAVVPIRPSVPAFCALVLLSAAWLWFYTAAIQDLHLLLLPMLLLTSIAGVLGWPAARAFIFPVAFIYFAMPAWSVLVTPLQTLSIHANSALIWLTGLPAYISGDVVQVPAGTLEIAGGCGGRHSFVVGITLAALYGELAGDPPRWRLTWIALMGALAMIANWVRIFVIIVAAEMTNMKTFLVTVDHYWFGWGVFVLAFFGFLWIAGRQHDSMKITPQSQNGIASDAARPQASPAAQRVSWAAFVVMLFCLGALPAFGYANDELRPVDGAISVNWPAAPQGWNGPISVAASDWQPRYQNASLSSQQVYLDPRGLPVEVFVVAYRKQQQGAKLLAYRNSLSESDGRLLPLEEQIMSSATGPWRQNTVVDASGQRSIIWSRYYIGARAFVRPRLAQLWYGVAAMTTPVLSSLTALRVVCQPDCASAQERLASASVQLQPKLQVEALPKERRSPSTRRGNLR